MPVEVTVYKEVRSHLKPAHIYVEKGEKVKLIMDCGNVLIVEKMNKERVPIPSIAINENDSGIDSEVQPRQTTPTRKQSKSVNKPIKQTLF